MAEVYGGLIDEQRAMIDRAATAGLLPSASELQRIGDLDSAITAVDAALEEEAES